MGVAGGKELKLLLKGKESRRSPEIDNLLASRAPNEPDGVLGDGALKRPPAAEEFLASFCGTGRGRDVRKVRRESGKARPMFLVCRESRLRLDLRAYAEGELQIIEPMSSSADTMSSSCELIEPVGDSNLLVGRPSFSAGAAKVSVPMDGRERKVLRLRLLSFERRLEPPFGLVGVGGMSSALSWLSAMRFAVGDCVSGWTSSSPSMLTKLPRR